MAIDIAKIFVSRDTVQTEAGLLQVFRAPDGGIHNVRIPRGLEECDPNKWVEILAVQTEVIGCAIHIFRAATSNEVSGLVWPENLTSIK